MTDPLGDLAKPAPTIFRQNGDGTVDVLCRPCDVTLVVGFDDGVEHRQVVKDHRRAVHGPTTWEFPPSYPNAELAAALANASGERSRSETVRYCRVYWGSHGCQFEREHDGLCECGCCDCTDHPGPDSGCVAKHPYYGPETVFYGEDVQARGLPHIDD